MKLVRFLVLFALLLGFWFTLSEQYNVLFISMGVASAALSAWFGGRLFDSAMGRPGEHPVINPLQLLVYIGWLLTRIVPSAIDVSTTVLLPARDPQPGMVRFRTDLTSPAARTMLATSITLVPGTMTVDVDGDEFTVHSFTPDAADDLATAVLQNRIAKVFRDGSQPRPEMVWESDHRPDARPGGRSDRRADDPATGGDA
jgi:multicomponent Na+:H+ antiporter subunit E